MNKKILPFLIIISSVLLWFFIIKDHHLDCLFQKLGKKNNVPNCPILIPDPSPEKSTCAKAGEEPVSNFDLRTGKTDPNIEIISCCEGLQAIQKKQRNDAPIIERLVGECYKITGVPNQICSPCGNRICDAGTEDYCNCKEDCKIPPFTFLFSIILSIFGGIIHN